LTDAAVETHHRGPYRQEQGDLGSHFETMHRDRVLVSRNAAVQGINLHRVIGTPSLLGQA
jgi:hypothetical protein